MDPNERKGWTEIIVPEEIDRYMVGIEQAETNAHLVVEMMDDFPLDNGSSLLVPGCGTGQMFDYIEPEQIGNYNFTFTDLASKFFKRLEERLSKTQDTRYVAVEDDIETTKLSDRYDGILTVLLLQHIEWKKGIDSMLKFSPSKMYFIIQEQETDKHPVAKGRKHPPSIEEFAKIAKPNPVPMEELVDYIEQSGYRLRLVKLYKRQVPDEKVMVGMVFGLPTIRLLTL